MSLRKTQPIDGFVEVGSDSILCGTNRKEKEELSWDLAVKMDNMGF